MYNRARRLMNAHKGAGRELNEGVHDLSMHTPESIQEKYYTTDPLEHRGYYTTLQKTSTNANRPILPKAIPGTSIAVGLTDTPETIQQKYYSSDKSQSKRYYTTTVNPNTSGSKPVSPGTTLQPGLVIPQNMVIPVSVLSHFLPINAESTSGSEVSGVPGNPTVLPLAVYKNQTNSPSVPAENAASSPIVIEPDSDTESAHSDCFISGEQLEHSQESNVTGSEPTPLGSEPIIIGSEPIVIGSEPTVMNSKPAEDTECLPSKSPPSSGPTRWGNISKVLSANEMILAAAKKAVGSVSPIDSSESKDENLPTPGPSNVQDTPETQSVASMDSPGNSMEHVSRKQCKDKNFTACSSPRSDTVIVTDCATPPRNSSPNEMDNLYILKAIAELEYKPSSSDTQLGGKSGESSIERIYCDRQNDENTSHKIPESAINVDDDDAVVILD